ncbi:MAG TPA: hypothetical protein VG146_03350 [Verrucomicrobiae bacterium]|nr:hypothetical protein [Verrucomicrobiae bacterium]
MDEHFPKNSAVNALANVSSIDGMMNSAVDGAPFVEAAVLLPLMWRIDEAVKQFVNFNWAG